MLMRCVIWTILGFLSGSVLYSYTLPKHIRGVDVTARSADGNPGVSNVFKYAGVGLGIVCLLLDIGKGAVPVYLASRRVDMYSPVAAAVAIAPVAGHAAALFYPSVRGGKAISVTFGVLIGLLPMTPLGLILAAIYIFFSVFVRINPHERRTVVTFLLFGTVCAAAVILGLPLSFALTGCGISAIVIFRNFEGARFGERDISPSDGAENESYAAETAPTAAHSMSMSDGEDDGERMRL